MAFKVDFRFEINNTKLAGYMISCSIVLVILFFLLFAHRDIEQNTRNVAMIAMAKSMQYRLNEYHEYWLLNKQPSSAEVNGNKVTFDSEGWVVPLENGQYSCQQLMRLANPKSEEKWWKNSELVQQERGIYECYYTISPNVVLLMKKVNGFSVSVTITL